MSRHAKRYSGPTRRALAAQGLSTERPAQPEAEPEPQVGAMYGAEDKLLDQTSIWVAACPVCGAQIGERCRKPNGDPRREHKKRAKLVAVGKKRRVEFETLGVRQVVSGGGFETNRRRH
jgi:hypothetical protein